MNYRYPNARILVFAKAPEAGQVKTRLIPPLSAEQAAELHGRLVTRTLKAVTRRTVAPVTLYCAPDTGHPFFRQCAQNYPLQLAQQQGNDLGQRMYHAVMEALQQTRYAIVIGTDTPAMNADYLEQAIQRLHSGSEVVIGPAEDGGYVLIGMKQPYEELFSDIDWGGAEVFSQTMEKAMQAGLQVGIMDTLRDVDRPADLQYILQLV